MPFAFDSYSPSVVQAFFEVARAVYGSVTPRNRELAVLGLCSILDAPYVVYCHRRVANKAGITDEQYECGLAGDVPNGLTEEEAMAYRLGRTFTSLTAPLDELTWRNAISKLDRAQVVGIIHVIGGYRWVALLEQVNGGK
jgi:4-carboxymuconolactone decarboxylase